MLDESKENLLYSMFIALDDFSTGYEKEGKLSASSTQLSGKSKQKKGRLALGEVLTILCFYHYSGYKCFQYYYEDMVLKDLKSFFPKAVSHHRFLELIPRCGLALYAFSQMQTQLSAPTGIYFADSKKLPVCDNRRIHSNRVFKGIAKRGKSSTGWFYGMKLHLVVNNLGQVMRFHITPANVSDNSKSVLDILFKELRGRCFADKGYLSKHFEHFFEQGFKVVTKIRKNMKNTLMPMSDKIWLKKRAVIESINDLLMTVFDIDHSRHRSPFNAIIHAIAGVVAYAFYPHKPSVFIPFELAI